MLLGRTATVARWTLLKEFVPKIQQVTREHIREVAKKYLVPNNLTVGGILVPIKSAKAPTAVPGRRTRFADLRRPLVRGRLQPGRRNRHGE